MTPAQQAEMDALAACADRGGTEFPALVELKDRDEDGEPEFRVGEDGNFLWAVPSTAEVRTSPHLFVCSGNVNARTIEFVESEGVSKRPQPPEVWNY